MLIEDFKKWVQKTHPSATAAVQSPRLDRAIKVQYTVHALRGRLPVDDIPRDVAVSLTDDELAEGFAQYLMQYLGRGGDLNAQTGEDAMDRYLMHWIPE